MIERRSTMNKRTGSVKYSSLKRAALLFFVLVMAILPVLTAYASSDSNIGKAKAKQIALKDAGFKESEVKKLKCGWKKDHMLRYEVTFRKGRYNYDYSVLPETGVIVEMEKRLRKIGKECGKTALSKKKALRIAMKDAGAKSVTKLKTKKKTYKGVRIWKIEFRAGGMDYEYKIGRYTGRIIKKERELDDDKY